MGLAEGIRRHGFRKWYERELLRGHAHLGAVIMCTLGLMMALEAATRFRSLSDQLIDFTAVVVCSSAGLWALRRYLFLLLRAEAIAHQADCPSCKAYGRLEVVSAGGASVSAASGSEGPVGGTQSVTVRCRACATVWQIHP
jgi:hypothetical protein